MRQQIISNVDAAAALRELMTEGEQALAFESHTPPGFDTPTRVTPKAPIVSRMIDLASVTIPALHVSHGNVTITPANPAKSLRMDAAVIEASRVSRAGAHVIIATERPQPQPGLALYSDSSKLNWIRPAEFSELADGATISDSALPWSSASIVWTDAPNRSFRTKITRRAAKSFGGVTPEEMLVHAIALGLAREADKVLLAAILATTPANFSLGAAAAQKLEFNDLRALVGTNGTGAFVSAAGVLVANAFNTNGWAGGIPAELTDTVADTVAGAFRFAGVAIRPEIQVLLERLNANGDLTATVHATMQPLIPDAAAFWKVV